MFLFSIIFYLRFNPEVGNIKSNGVHLPVYLYFSCSKKVYGFLCYYIKVLNTVFPTPSSPIISILYNGFSKIIFINPDTRENIFFPNFLNIYFII
jgi:hypothetical protein